jgi:hypothetical protein
LLDQFDVEGSFYEPLEPLPDRGPWVGRDDAPPAADVEAVIDAIQGPDATPADVNPVVAAIDGGGADTGAHAPATDPSRSCG